MPINRRELAKGIAAGLAAGGIPPLPVAAEQQERPLTWTAVYPGIWRARLGTPETHTPVSMRHVQPATGRMAKLPSVTTPPIALLQGEITRCGCRLTLPLEAGERIYGFGLQLLSMQQRGKKRIIRVNADPKGDSGDSARTCSVLCYDAWLRSPADTLRHAEFYCGEVHPAPSRAAKTGGGAVNTPQEVKEKEHSAVSNVLVEVPRAGGVEGHLLPAPRC